MNKKFVLLIFSILITSVFTLTANASYYYDDGSNDDNPNVDKFVPSSGVKIKESGLARMMENATRDAMDSSKGKKTSKSVEKTKQNTVRKNNESNTRSYKWF